LKKIVSIDEFTKECPYFYNSGTSVNNGYNCAHPECGDHDTTDAEYVKDAKIGRCHTFTCPLAPEADEEDFTNDEIDKNEWTEYEEGNFFIVEVND
jgi:hypothetical protein